MEQTDQRHKVKAFRLNETAFNAVINNNSEDSPQVQLIKIIQQAEVPFEALSILFNIDERLLTRYIYTTSIPSEEDKDLIYRKIPLILNEALNLQLLPCSDKRAIIPILQASVRLILQAKRLESLAKQ